MRRAAAAILGVYASWLIAVHIFLWTPLLRKIIEGKSDNIHLQYHFAYSIFPGTVHATGVVITLQDHAQQFRLAIDEVTANITLTQLPRRIFHATKVRAKGLTFAMRRRLAPGEVTPEALVGLPYFPGLPPIPEKEYGVDDPNPDFRYKLFSVWLEDIKGDDVRELWFDKFRLEGRANVAGAFYLKPQREVYISPADLHIDSATLRSDGDAIAQNLRGNLEFRLDPMDPRELPPERFLKDASLRSDLKADLVGLEFLGAKGGAGTLELDANVEHGQIVSGNKINIELNKLSYKGYGAHELKLLVESTKARIEMQRFHTPGSTIEKALVVLKGDAPNLADLKMPKTIAADLMGGRIEDATKLSEALMVPQGLVTRGTGDFMLHLEEQGSGVFQLNLKQLAVDARGKTFNADIALDAHLSNVTSQGADLSGTTVNIENAGVKSDPKARIWWGHFTLPRAGFRTNEKETLDADLEADCRDARPIIGLYAAIAKLPGVVQTLFTMDGLHVRGSAAAGKGWVTLRDLHASGKGAEIRAVLDHQKGEEQGAVWFKVGILPLAIGLGQGGGLHILHPGDYFTERKAALGHAPQLPSLRHRHK